LEWYDGLAARVMSDLLRIVNPDLHNVNNANYRPGVEAISVKLV